MQLYRTSLTLLTFICVILSSHAAEPAVSPYGACSHLAREEFDNRETTMRLMQASGIQWARADFTWGTVEPKPGEWQFERFDEVLKSAAKYNIQILPILDYNSTFANPAWQHLDKWELYVRNMVERYQGQIPVWEIWNEQNLEGFWKDPKPENYLPLLKKSYETIKSINPELQVAVGGFAGMPFEYIEKLYEIGGGKYFDIMNVHPYSHPRPPEMKMEQHLTKLNEIMKKYGDADKPLWITEVGWPTPESVSETDDIISVSLKTLLPKKKLYRVICIKDPALGKEGLMTVDEIAAKLPQNSSIQLLDFDAVKPTLDNYEIDVVVMPVSENYHLDGFERIIQYVKDGGIVVDLHGMPFWYGYTRNKKGALEKSSQTSFRKMRVQADGWWNKKGVIPEEMEVKYTGPVAKLANQPKQIIADRFISPSNFKEGDRFIPLLQGRTDKYTGTAAAIFDFNSDWQGAIIISTLSEGVNNAVDIHGQAQMLPRAQLIARRCGVERIFWYEFQAPERDPLDKESHFGIVHKDFSEKSAYAAYKTLTKQLPPSSAFIDKEWHKEDKSLYYPQWKRADGTLAGALWAHNASGIYNVEFSGGTPSFVTHQGKHFIPHIKGDSVILALTGSPLYFSGAQIKDINQKFEAEDALSAALPAAFSRAESQYTALLKAMEGTENLQPRRWQNNKLVTVGPKDWTSGFFPGSLWYLYEYTNNKSWEKAAIQYTSILEQIRNYNGNHDIGFMLYCSYGNALRLAENKEGIKEILLDGAAALCTRFVPSLGMIRSWDSYNNPVIIDNMMNLELLMWASRNSDNPLFKKVALSHADQTNERHFRADGSAYHIVDYNPISKKVFGYYAGQGASADAPWARGQSWGLYGFTMMFRETGKSDYLKRAIRCADFLINHPNLPADKIPYWDYEAAEIPYAPRDVAAGAIMASALLELSTFKNVPNAKMYRAVAVQQLLSLSSPEYLAQAGQNGNFILMHAVGHLPGNSEIDVPLNYADYYYLEALLRFKKLQGQ
jgi:unsaturated chondroitin disaccharide hydrolase